MRLAPLLFTCLILASCSSSIRTESDYSPQRGSSDRGEPASGLSRERRTVLTESGKWLGTPYRYGGSSRSGADCSGFVSTVYASVGISLPRRARDMYESGAPVPLQRIIPGDLVFFSNTAGKGITHVGIYTGKSQFIHASTSSGVITSSLEQAYYNKHFAGARKVLQ